jgi:hypothetical protein
MPSSSIGIPERLAARRHLRRCSLALGGPLCAPASRAAKPSAASPAGKYAEVTSMLPHGVPEFSPLVLVVMGVSGSARRPSAQSWPGAFTGTSRMRTIFTAPPMSPRDPFASELTDRRQTGLRRWHLDHQILAPDRLPEPPRLGDRRPGVHGEIGDTSRLT